MSAPERGRIRIVPLLAMAAAAVFSAAVLISPFLAYVLMGG